MPTATPEMPQPLERPAGVAPSRQDGLAPFHLFNPPPSRLMLQAKLSDTAPTRSNGAPTHDFMLQLPRQRMRPAMRVHSEDLGEGATAWRLLPPSTPEQPAPTPARLETAAGVSVPTLLPGSPQAARLPPLPTDDGAASSRHEDSPTSQGMNTLPPTRLDGAGLRCDVQPDGSLHFVMRDDPRNECAPPCRIVVQSLGWWARGLACSCVST